MGDDDENRGVSETTLVAARHGETEWNRQGRLQGWAPVGLTERGREQARALGRRLADAYEFDRVVASDLCRARETTALVRESDVEPEPTFSAGWRERGFGVYQGLTHEQLFERYPEFDAANGQFALETRPEGGESVLDLRERVLAAADDLQGGDETVLVVTHGGPLSVLLGEATGQDLVTAITERSLENCAVREFRVSPDGLGLTAGRGP